MLCKAAALFSALNALLASINSIASVSGSSQIFHMASIEASVPPRNPAHVWSGAVAATISGCRSYTVNELIILLNTSPIPIGRTPGFLSRGMRQPATKARRNFGFTCTVFSFLPTLATTSQRPAGFFLH